MTTASAPAPTCPVPTGPYAVSSDGAGHGWMVGNAFAAGESAVALTADGGQTWVGSCIPLVGRLVDVTSYGETHVWAVGLVPDGPVVLFSTDGGRTWGTSQFANIGHLDGIAFADPLHGWAVGGGWDGSGIIVATSDGGRSWAPQHVPDGVMGLNAAAFADPLHGWVVGANIGGSGGRYPTVLSTSDGGVTWATKPIPAGSGSGLLDVAVVGANRIVVVGQGSTSADHPIMGVTAISDDGGLTWTATEIPDIFFWAVAVHGQHLLAVGQSGASGTWGGGTYASDDGGITWAKTGRAGSASLTGAALADDDTGWAVSFQQACLYITDDGARTWRGRPLAPFASCP